MSDKLLLEIKKQTKKKSWPHSLLIELFNSPFTATKFYFSHLINWKSDRFRFVNINDEQNAFQKQ